ncbi:MAG: YetF domain-containing protein, partial [Gaiellales bacterium]
FPLVVILVRIVNRRQLSSLEPFDVVLLVVIGDLLQQGITLAELAAQARQNNIPTLDRVRYAVVETSGSISFITE